MSSKVRYNDIVINQFLTFSTGTAAVAATVTVYVAGTVTKATLYDEFDIEIPNPVTTDSEGAYFFYVDSGYFDLTINKGLLSERTIYEVSILNYSPFVTREEIVPVIGGQLEYTFSTTAPLSGSAFFMRDPDSDLGARLIEDYDYILRPDINNYTLSLLRSWEAGNVIQRVYNEMDGGAEGDGYFRFGFVADLVLSSLPVGARASLDRYYSGGELVDGLNYTVMTSLQAALAGYTIDEYANHTLANGNVAVVTLPNTVEQFGAVGGIIFDSTLNIQAAIDYHATDGVMINFTKPQYKITGPLRVDNTTNLYLKGVETEIVAVFTADDRLIQGDATNGMIIQDMAFNQQYSITGFGAHGFSLQNPTSIRIIKCRFYDFRDFGVLMYTTDRNASGIYRNCHIIDCYANGKNVSTGGGFAMESLADSTITGYVTNISGNTPGYSVNLKNNCTNCMVDVLVTNSNSGVVLSDDGPNTVGNGVKDSFIKAQVTNCTTGASFNKCENVRAELNIDGGGISGGVLLGIFGFNFDCNYTASLANGDPAGYAITSRSDNQTINVKRYDMSALKLANFEVGTDRNRLIVDSTSISGTGLNIADYVDDFSTNLNNEIVYLRDCPTAYQSSGTWASQLILPVRGAALRSNYLISANTANTMGFRVNAVNMLALEQTTSSVSAGTDNTISLGRASFRYSEVFAANGAINTSDDREKTYLTINAAETAAAIEIKTNLKKFKFNTSIALKGEENARIHFGASAQQVGIILTSHGLNPDNYGFYCYDEWEAEPAQFDADGNQIKPALEAGNRYGIRYEELLCFLMASI